MITKYILKSRAQRSALEINFSPFYIAFQNNDGSPLVQNGKVIGIASASEGCVNGNPDVYTNVYKNLDFINKAIVQNLN